MMDSVRKAEESTTDIEIKENMVLLGKIPGFPRWPCVVINEADFDLEEKPNDKEDWYVVQFFNDAQFAWLTKKDLSLYDENIKNLVKTYSKNKNLLDAVKDATYQLSLKLENPDYYIKISKRKKQNSQKNGHSLIKKKQSFIKETQENLIQLNNFVFKKPMPKKHLGIITGIGFLGQEITKNLLRKGYKIYFYDVDNEKWIYRLEKIFSCFGKVKKLLSARAVLAKSDILFLCLSNEKQARDIIDKNFELDDPHNNLVQKKGIINFTTMEPDTSIELSKIIARHGGKYLEMATQGSEKEASEANLMLFTAGHQDLFEEIRPYLEAIGTSAYYLGATGYALKINLTLQMIKGVSLAVLGESFSLVESLGIPKDKFAELLNVSGLASDYVKIKSTVIMEKNFNDVKESVDYLQYQMKVGLDMADNAGHPLSIVNSANQMFKYCQKNQYGSHDASIIVEHPFHI